MSKHLLTGKQGESHAVAYLTELGYKIKEQNWRFSRAEIDIIAEKNDIIVFVEVKTRASDYYGKPEEFVSAKKERLIADAASQYLEAINHTWEFRFDIISIILKNEKLISIDHFEDAFFPGLE